MDPLIREGLDAQLVRTVTEAFMSELLGVSKAKTKAKDAEAKDSQDGGDKDSLKTGQVTVIGRPEVEFILGQVRDFCSRVDKVSATDKKKIAKEIETFLGRDGRKNLQAIRLAAGLDAAMFGRMVTSDILSRMDAAIHVAHAFTVHAEASESDYFSAVDELTQGKDGELGSGHINAAELTSGLYYGYVVVDVPLLVANLMGCARSEVGTVDRTLAASVVNSLVHLLATVSPGAKLGSTAPYAHAHLVLAESGKAQPRTLANAFLAPVREQPDLLVNAYAALARHVVEMDGMYGKKTERRLAGMGKLGAVLEAVGSSEPCSLDSVAEWAAGQVRGS